jgi:hypothetical protein
MGMAETISGPSRHHLRLDIIQLSGAIHQRKTISLSRIPQVDDIGWDLKNARISVQTVPTVVEFNLLVVVT